MATRTSSTHPIRVDFVPADVMPGAGRLGMTFAPGKKAGGIDSLWDRDLAADLALLRNFHHADVLVSLVEDFELDLLKIPDLVSAARAAGILVERLPIPDGGVPSDIGAFTSLVASTVARLRRGEVVVVHCRGGLGRTGLFAAACLRALGNDAERAMRLVRDARPGTIENRAQEEFVRRVELVASAREHAGPHVDRVLGCILGGAIGDALGAPVEFNKSARDITTRFGSGAPAKLGFAGSPHFTDDTQMTLFAAEGILRAGAARWDASDALVASTRGAFLRWYTTQEGGEPASVAHSPAGWLVKVAGLHHRRAPGNTCLSSLESQSRGAAAPSISQPPNDSKGCGAVMRSAPFGLAARSREQAFAWARDTGVLTHGHPSGYLSAAHFAAVIYDVARGESLLDAISAADELLARERGHEETLAAVAKARRLFASGAPAPAAIESLGGAWVGEEALAISLLCAATCDGSSPGAVAAALWRSVAHAGDSDSTGSMTGNLLGAMHGVRALPPAWLAELELRDVLERVATELHGCAAGQPIDEQAFPPIAPPARAVSSASSPHPAPASSSATEPASLNAIPVEARVFDDGLLGVKQPVALRPGVYDAVLVVGARRPDAREVVAKPNVVADYFLPLEDFLERARREHVRQALAATDGNRTQAARLLGVDVRTVFRILGKEDGS